MEKTMLEPESRLLQNFANSSDHDIDIPGINESYQRYDHHVFNYGDRVEKAAQNYASYNSNWNNMQTQFEAQSMKVNGDDSGADTPPLWPTSPQHRAQHYRSLSPTSRTQAIARGQRELMEMVSKMPESCYELSLKDLVERPSIIEAKQERFEEEKSMINNNNNEKVHQRTTKSDKKLHKQMKRSESIDNGGLFLKMVTFPDPFGLKRNTQKKNKKKNDFNNGSNKVSPRPSVSADGGGGTTSSDKEWWKKRFAVSSESESVGSRNSNNSGSTKSSGSGSSSSRSSSTRSNSRKGSRGCWSFLRTKKSKSKE